MKTMHAIAKLKPGPAATASLAIGGEIARRVTSLATG